MIRQAVPTALVVVPLVAIGLVSPRLVVDTESSAEPTTVHIDARSMQPGEVALVTVTTETPAGLVATSAMGRDWRPFKIDDRTWQVVIGIDLDTAPGNHPLTVTVDSTAVDHQLSVTAKQFPTRRLTVAPGFVNPPADVLDRITSEARTLAAIWTSSAADRLWSGPFVRPVSDPANSAFGTRSVFNGQPRSPHGGADFRSPLGTDVHAPNSGRVVLAADLYYTGNTVVIDHGLGLVSLFAHLSQTEVEAGDLVATRQVVGQVGSTGRVTGPHLHWTLRAGGARVDPLSLLAVLGSATNRP